MQLSYDGEFGNIEILLHEDDITELGEQKRITQNGLFVCIDDKYEIPEPVWDEVSPTKILGISISERLFKNFLDAKPDSATKACNYIERIGGSFSVELIRREHRTSHPK